VIAMRHYIALIHKDADSDYGISFPDFPGCVTAGSTLQEALTMAQEALAGHIEILAEDGETIPAPSDMDRIMARRENRDGVAILVPAPPRDEKIVRVNVTLPEGLLKRIDAIAENRSKFLAGAAEQALRNH
jgi:predicted RNase H-like HicB family nuclease